MAVAAKGSVTWLHLSDLHAFSSKTNWDSYRITKALTEDLAKMSAQHGLRPDFIFFTGDLAFGNVPAKTGKTFADQFDEGAAFLEAVRQSFSPPVPLKRVFLVPGNHDVDRSQATEDQFDWLDRCSSVDEVLKHISGPTKQWQRYAERLGEYRNFLQRHGFSHLLQDPERLLYGARVQVNCVDVGIAGLNSAWSCGRDNEIGRLWVAGDWQVGTIAPFLDGADINIALIHHPGNWFVEYENPHTWRVLQREFSVVVHGHEHTSWATTQDDHTAIAAGACYENSKKPTGYNFTRIYVRERRGEIWLRRYDPKSGKWIPDIIGGRNDNASGTWEFRNTTLFRDPRREWSRQEVERLVACEPILVFARGTRTEPRDGYTTRVVTVLDSYKVPYRVVDVSTDGKIAAAVLAWNQDSFPQVYIGGSFVGGSDRIDELHTDDALGDIIRGALP